ncbi:AmmeMemoRadiSam system protein A [Actinotalea sp. M2MS4P-6]|uniref:AmmeMemoRadiSam system protein A n=1 Tax=Actinotalea sp. M2MS4P-6 TaxID=2983762 RepID=UPI0021E435CB|nr:AmmeMemoRadiSam system protein A [Actinotalea sp. M2MS4P-6]MCV2394842.1 AmmeMemoRadiSam system protein A [Actinotalea sp. M2MS4P-6]
MPRSASTSPPERDGAALVTPPPLPDDAGPVLLRLARAAVARELGERVDVDESADWLARPGAAFVTLWSGPHLRGCIGSLEARRPLREDVEANARAAAFRDPRFVPLSRAELATVQVEVSVLSDVTPFPVADEADALARLRPGVDGVVLTCCGRRGTLLPQVWERLPAPVDFLAALRTKAGLPAGFWSDEVRLGRYTVSEYAEEV